MAPQESWTAEQRERQEGVRHAPGASGAESAVMRRYRPARPADSPTIQAVELAAQKRFRVIGLTQVADDDGAHIVQVTVLPERQGQGLGRGLLDRAIAWAPAAGLGAVTLTTFSEVPWNRPLYEHLGFEVMAEAEIGPGLRAVQEEEAAHGLGPDGRVAMRLRLGS